MFQLKLFEVIDSILITIDKTKLSSVLILNVASGKMENLLSGGWVLPRIQVLHSFANILTIYNWLASNDSFMPMLLTVTGGRRVYLYL